MNKNSFEWRRAGAAAALFFLGAASSFAAHGTVERIEVRGQSLEGNLSNDPAVRDVAVYLPPSYAAEPERRYPVVYMLHGFTDSVEKWWFDENHWITLNEVVDRSLDRDDTQEMIVVMPDAHTRFFGSFYSNSVTTGDWESYVSQELVAFIDSHYRTLAKRESRGLAGHSMGGYGTMRIGMKYPDVFSSVYLLSPCCLAPTPSRAPDGPPPWESVKTDEEAATASFFTKIVLAFAASWAPNPQNPPFYMDLPTKDGEVQPGIVAKFAANAPLAQIDQHITRIRQLNAIAFDAGDEDRGIAAAIRVLDGVLKQYDIEHDFEIYDGDHLNRIPERIETKTMPFFSRHLAVE